MRIINNLFTKQSATARVSYLETLASNARQSRAKNRARVA